MAPKTEIAKRLVRWQLPHTAPAQLALEHPVQDDLAAAADEIERLRAVLELIAGFKGLTLLCGSLGPDCDRAHQIGANKAFNQAAEIAQDALDTLAASSPESK